MKKLLVYIFLLLSVTAYSQSIGNIFKRMPADMLPGFTDANKTMLLVDTGKTVVPYALGEIVKDFQTDDYLKLKTSDVGTIQLKLLPITADSSIVCVIRTVCASACDSHITFFTTEWEDLKSNDFLPVISKEIFFDSSQKNSDKYKYAVSLPDISPISAEFVRGQKDLTLKFDVETYLSSEVFEEIKPLLKSESVILKWNNKQFN